METSAPKTARDFDHPDRLNEDGTVTLRMQPSNWRAYNISPDTYQTVNGDHWCEQEIEHFNEASVAEFQDWFDVDKTGVTLDYDDFHWTYDHAGIVRDFSEVLAGWIFDKIHYHAYYDREGYRELEEVVIDWTVLDSWSPQFYNFQSDGFEMELTVDPMVLRRLTPDFDLDEWVRDHYASRDGFLSFVTGRVRDHDEWAADYDGQFRIEYLLAKEIDPHRERQWIMSLAEAEWEVYSNRTTIEVREDVIRERQLYRGTEYTLAELEEWAGEIERAQYAGMEPLIGEAV